MAEFIGPRLYSCHKCRNHVSLHDDIVSKAFQVRNIFIPKELLIFKDELVSISNVLYTVKLVCI